MTDNVAIGWDDEITSEMIDSQKERQEFVTLPEGVYAFRVAKVERGQYNGSERMPACGMVKLGIIVDGGEKGNSYITTNFYMCQKTLWKIFEFMTSVGLHKHGEQVSKVPWDKVDTTCQGKVKIGLRKFTNREGVEQSVNEVVRWIDNAPTKEEY